MKLIFFYIPLNRYCHTFTKGLTDDKTDGLLIKFIMYYQENKEELNYFINSEFEKEFALDSDLKPYKLLDEQDKNYFIKCYIDRIDNLENQVNIIDYKSKKANRVTTNNQLISKIEVRIQVFGMMKSIKMI